MTPGRLLEIAEQHPPELDITDLAKAMTRPDLDALAALRLDGRDTPLPEGAVVKQHPAGARVLHIPRLDLTDYGNRVPRIEVGG